MKNRRFSFLVFAFFFGSLVAGFAQEQTSFQLLRGNAQFFRNGGATWLDLGPQPITVRTGDKLRTGNESRGDLKMADGSVIRLKSGALITFFDTSVQMQLGEVLFTLKRQGKPFQVLTPTSISSVLGTTFDITVDPFGKTRVRVFDGIVSVKAHDQQNRQLVLQRGMTTMVADRRFISDQPQRFDLTSAQKELTETLEKPKLGPALPPIRTAIPMTMGVVGKEGKVSTFTGPQQRSQGEDQEKEKEEAAEEGSLRDNLSFFDSVKQHRAREYLNARQKRDHEEEKALSPQNSLPKSLPPEDLKAPIDPAAIRSSFGNEAIRGHGDVRHQDEPQIRNEIMRTETQLHMLQEEIQTTKAELERLRKLLTQATTAQNRRAALSRGTKVSVTPANNTTTTTSQPEGLPPRLPLDIPAAGTASEGSNTELIKEKIRIQDVRQRAFLDQQQKLVQRLHDLRNRLY